MDTGGLCNLFDPSLSQRLGAVGNVLADMSIEQIRVLTDHSNVISLTQTQLIDTKPFGLMITDPVSDIGITSVLFCANTAHQR